MIYLPLNSICLHSKILFLKIVSKHIEIDITFLKPTQDVQIRNFQNTVPIVMPLTEGLRKKGLSVNRKGQ